MSAWIMVAALAGRRAGGRIPFLSTGHRQCGVLFPVAGGKTLLFWDHCGDARAQDHPLASPRRGLSSLPGGKGVFLRLDIQLLFV